MRLATRGAEILNDVSWIEHSVATKFLLNIAGIRGEEVTVRVDEDLFTYLTRMFPLFLEAIEVLYGPMNASPASRALWRAALRRAEAKIAANTS